MVTPAGAIEVLRLSGAYPFAHSAWEDTDSTRWNARHHGGHTTMLLGGDPFPWSTVDYTYKCNRILFRYYTDASGTHDMWAEYPGTPSNAWRLRTVAGFGQLHADPDGLGVWLLAPNSLDGTWPFLFDVALTNPDDTGQNMPDGNPAPNYFGAGFILSPNLGVTGDPAAGDLAGLTSHRIPPAAGGTFAETVTMPALSGGLTVRYTWALQPADFGGGEYAWDHAAPAGWAYHGTATHPVHGAPWRYTPVDRTLGGEIVVYAAPDDGTLKLQTALGVWRRTCRKGRAGQTGVLKVLTTSGWEPTCCSSSTPHRQGPLRVNTGAQWANACCRP